MSRQIKSTLILVLLVSFAIGASNFLAGSTVAASPVLDKKNSTAAATFQDAMDKLWEDHITWTRLFIVSVAADLPDKGPTTNRLLQNQSDIGNAIKPYYGDAAGEKLTTLLKEHITTAAEVVGAAKANDKTKLDDANKRWLANADQIADFLSSANAKNWAAADMRSMMRDHLNLTTAEAVARLKGDWAGDIAAYDKVHEQILHMADMLSTGIIQQHSAKFR